MRSGWMPIMVVLFLAAGMTAAGRERIDPETQRRFADGLMLRGLHEHAIREYQVLREEHPDYAEMDVIDYRIAESYRNMTNLAAAVRTYERVIEHEPPSPYRHRAMLRRAEMYRLADRKDVTVRLLRELLAETPDAAIRDAAIYWIGRSLVATGERDEATHIWRDFLARDRVSAFTPFVALELGKLLASGDSGEAQQEAADRLRRVLDDPPDPRHGAEALYQLARMYERFGDDEQAAQLFDDFLRDHATDVRAADIRLPAAWAYYRVGRFADSLRLCNETLAGGIPDNGGVAAGPWDQWYYLKANNERQLGKHATAVDTYSRLLESRPDSPLSQAAVLEKAQSQYKLGDRERSLETVRGTRVGDAHRLPALWLQATAHDELGNDSEAIQNYRLLIEQFPESDQAYEATYRLGLLFQRRGDALQAAESFQATAERFPERPMAPRALLAAAEQMRSLDRHAEAVREYGRLLEAYPEHELVVEALYRKGVSEAQLGRDEQAARTLRELTERFPDTQYLADTAFTLGLLYSREGNYADAEAVLDRALNAGPEAALRSRILFRRAFALQQLGRGSEAAQLFELLLDDPHMDRFDPPLLEWLSRMLREEQRFPEAIHAADILVESAGEEPGWLQTGHALAGLAALEAGDGEQARRRFEAALETDVHTPLAAEAAVALGEILLEDRRIDDARYRFHEGEQHARQADEPVLRARALLGLGACSQAHGDLTDANRYYSIVGLTYNIPGVSDRALRKAAETFEQLDRPADRDKMLLELEQRYGD